MKIVYVGDFDSAPKGTIVLSEEFSKVPPEKFKELVFPDEFYTNNPYIVDVCGKEIDTHDNHEIICCNNGKIKPLRCHPEWQKWKDEVSIGEFWSLFGTRWFE